MPEADVVERVVSGRTNGGVRVGADADRDRFKLEQVAQAPGESTELELSKFIANRQKTRAKSGDSESYAEKEARRYREMVEAQTRERREYNRFQWIAHHEQAAKRWREQLEELIAHHEEQARRYRSISV